MAKGYAQFITSLAIKQGVPKSRAKELVAAAIRESGLNPRAVNKSSGAAGLFQLLSSGYVNKAKSLGGVFNPRANTLAILPNYLKYWRQHPNAAPGAAAAAVEASGMPASWYAEPLRGMGGETGGVSGASPPRAQTIPPLDNSGNALLQAVLDSPTGDLTSALPSIFAARNVPLPVPTIPGAFQPPAFVGNYSAYGTPAELLNEGVGGPTHSTGPHIHVAYTNPQSVLSAIRLAQSLGLRIGENPYVGSVSPVHAKNSYHYRTFPGLYGGKHLGEAIDVSGPKMKQFYRMLGGK